MKEKRDSDGKIKDSMITRFKSWNLGRKIRKGKLPRGRTSSEVQKALAGTCQGECGEIWGILSAQVIRKDSNTDLGVISTKKVTEAFRNYIVDSLQNSTTAPLDVFKYHGSGTGTTAEANTQTALVTEVESRATGTQIEGSTANIYKSVGTVSYTGTRAITEHGLFSASSSGTLLDRSLFTAINVDSGDAIQFTYECTFNAET